MKHLYRDIRLEWGLRAYHAILFGFLFLAIGVLVPKIYYKYFDHRQYIQIDPVTYNKKVFTPCEEVVSTTHYKSDISTDIKFSYRLFEVKGKALAVVNNSDQTINTFINKTEVGGETLVSQSRIPCNFKPGVYFVDGLVTYFVKGEPHFAPYRGATTTVEATPSAVLNEN